MKLHPFLTLLGLVLGTVTWAAPRPIEKQELASQLTYYQSIQTLRTKFHEIKTLKEMKLTLESDGELTVIRPSKVIWKVTRPSPLTVILEESRLQILDSEGKGETLAIEGEAKKSLKSLVAWLKLDPNELFETYQISDLGENKFRFEPKVPAESPLRALVMQIRPKSYVEQLQIEERSGDSLTIRFEKPRIEQVHGK
jgi:outer membrane lipoprotein-sorting protein